MARRKAPMIPNVILDQLLDGLDAKDAFGRDGLLDALKKALAERALGTERLIGAPQTAEALPLPKPLSMASTPPPKRRKALPMCPVQNVSCVRVVHYERWRKRDLSARRHVYLWADGVYLQARMEHASRVHVGNQRCNARRQEGIASPGFSRARGNGYD